MKGVGMKGVRVETRCEMGLGWFKGMRFCGWQCKGAWVEVACLVVVVVCVVKGWNWDGGYCDQWVDSLIAQGSKEEAAKNEVKNMEEGGVASVDENGAVVVVEEEDVVDEKQNFLVDLKG